MTGTWWRDHALPNSEKRRRFLLRVDVTPAGCWEWRDTRNEAGYGVLKIARKMQRAHRVSWNLHNGPIPDGLFVLHRCDNRPCVNPDHLFLGTLADNNHDMIEKGRYVGNRYGEKTHCKRGHEFNTENTRRTPSGKRECRTCRRLWKRDRRRVR